MFSRLDSKFFFKLLVTIPVAPIITGIILHFRFHIRCISIHKLLYFNFIIIIIIIIIIPALAFSLGGSSPYTSRDNPIRINIHKCNNKKHSTNNTKHSKYKLPKHPHITNPHTHTHTHTYTHTHTLQTHTHTHTLQTHTHTHTPHTPTHYKTS